MAASPSYQCWCASSTTCLLHLWLCCKTSDTTRLTDIRHQKNGFLAIAGTADACSGMCCAGVGAADSAVRHKRRPVHITAWPEIAGS